MLADMLPDPRDPAFVGALIYFNKAAERLSFADAASDLGVTPSAVSHRVAALEAALGKRLFERETRRVRLTREGAELANITMGLWDELRRITDNLTARRVLRVSVGPYISSHWLMPRLAAFERQHLGARVDLVHVIGAPDLRSVDVAIVWADRASAPPDGALLFSVECFPICAPGLQVTQPFRASALPPIHYRDRRPWQHWLRATGNPVEFARHGEILDDPNLVLEAAAHGRGIAIGFSPFVDGMIQGGRLAAASTKSVLAENGYWVAIADPKNSLSKHFATWLSVTAGEMSRDWSTDNLLAVTDVTRK